MSLENEERGKISLVNYAWQKGKIKAMNFLLENKFNFHDHEKIDESLVSLLRNV